MTYLPAKALMLRFAEQGGRICFLSTKQLLPMLLAVLSPGHHTLEVWDELCADGLVTGQTGMACASP